MNEIVKQLIDQARKKSCGNSWTYCSPLESEERIVELVANAVFEECVRVCENIYNDPDGNNGDDYYYTRPHLECAEEIRLRKKTWVGNMK